MTDALRPIPVETLLGERAWVTALARSLVADEATADDLVQQTWLAAIRSPPRELGALRGWLARVVRNAASESHRRTVRRARHEQAADVRRPEPAPEQTVARAETHRSVVEAVMALEEPYRTAVLLRYFDGLAAAEVARRTGVPVETARTRIKRALAMLRARLDREHGRDGTSWALALLPLARLDRGMVATGATGGALVAISTTKVLAAVVAGALFGALVMRAAMSPDDVPMPASPPESASAPARTAGAQPESTPSKSSTRATNATSAPVAQASPALVEAIGEVTVDAPRFVAGTIGGRVRTNAGDAVPGVVVRAWTQRPSQTAWRRGSVPAVPPVDEVVRAAIADVKWREATQREAVTGADGAFDLARLVDGTYHVNAWAAGFDVRVAQGSSYSARPGATVEFVATAVVDVPVRVEFADGTGPADPVLVRWTHPERGGGGSAWWAASDPVVAIEPGSWTLTAEIGKDVRSAAVPLTVSVGTAPAPVTLRLAGRNVVQGVVRFDPADVAWESVDVVLRPKGSTDRGAHEREAKPPDWTFRFEDVPLGDHELVVLLDRDAVLASAAVHVTGGAVAQDLVIPKLTPSLALIASVTGADGKPLDARDVSFGLRGSSATGGMGIGTRGVRRSDGTFVVLLGIVPEHMTNAEWTLEVTSRSLGRMSPVGFDRGTTATVEVCFGEAAKFRPTLVGAEGKAYAGRLSVMLALPGQDDTAAFNTRIGDAVQPGRYIARVLLGADVSGQLYLYRHRVLARIPVDLRAGDNAVSLNVPELHTLTLVVPGAETGTDVQVHAARRPGRDGFAPQQTVGDGGRVVCPELPAGAYCVTVTLQGETQQMIVQVPAYGDVTFVPTELRGFVVTVEDPAGLLAKAGFGTGDVIVAIDGTATDSFRRADNVLYAAHRRDSVPVDVERGGRRVRLEIDPTKLWSSFQCGGWWEPVPR